MVDGANLINTGGHVKQKKQMTPINKIYLYIVVGMSYSIVVLTTKFGSKSIEEIGWRVEW